MKIKSLDDIPSVNRYLKRIGAEARSFKRAVVKEKIGNYWKDSVIIKFTKKGFDRVNDDEYSPNEKEISDMRAEFAHIKFPSLKKLPSISQLPDGLKNKPSDDIFTFRDLKGDIVMIQLRVTPKEGDKYFLPFTYWDDEEWRNIEPDGKLPLWGMEQINDNTTVFIHEGAKAARAVKKMIAAQTPEEKEKLKAHPWGKELGNAAHVGWIGGALSAGRTDWNVINRSDIKKAYIVSDNDKLGVSAVPDVSIRLKIPTFHLQFTNEWPATFDLADEFPDKMFRSLDGKRRYIGPSFRSCLHPATWATDQIPVLDGKPLLRLREHFKDMWAYIEEADIFVCRAMPNIVRQEKILNNMLCSFSHAKETCSLILRAYNGRTTGLCYRPDKKEVILTNGSSSSINLHIPTDIKSEPGDPKPFIDFMEYMFPIDEERNGVLKWVATLIAKPHVRMEYGMLLVSEATGIGKTTLGSAILAPLVEKSNVGWPRENDIVDNAFNDWVANKRLVIVNEIYSGHSWKAYHSLKSLITDTEITVNQKFQKPYVVDNWCHIFACSNSMRALKMEEDDRRWFYPQITETRWKKEQFVTFRDWLGAGGLGIIKMWAEGFGQYVSPGERAPMTERKKEMIEGSRSEAQTEAVALAEALLALERPAGLAMKDIIGAIRNSVQGKVFDSDYQIKKIMLAVGAIAFPKRMRVSGRLQYVIMNEKLQIESLNKDGVPEKIIVANIIKPQDLVAGEM